jgi:hypothetical protein
MEGRGKNIIFAKKTTHKNPLFSSKKGENILFWTVRGGQGPLFVLPRGCPWSELPALS